MPPRGLTPKCQLDSDGQDVAETRERTSSDAKRCDELKSVIVPSSTFQQQKTGYIVTHKRVKEKILPESRHEITIAGFLKRKKQKKTFKG